MESVFSGTLIQKMTKFPHGDNFYGDPDITSFVRLNILCFRKQPKRINWIWRENVTEGKKTKDISGEEV